MKKKKLKAELSKTKKKLVEVKWKLSTLIAGEETKIDLPNESEIGAKPARRRLAKQT